MAARGGCFAKRYQCSARPYITFKKSYIWPHGAGAGFFGGPQAWGGPEGAA